jgi:hypothetical protein
MGGSSSPKKLFQQALFIGSFWFYHYTQKQHPEIVSVLQLVATPERYHHKHIVTVGFMRLEFEGNALFISREAEQYGLPRNHVRLNIEEKEPQQKLDDLRKKYVLVQGIFKAGYHGYRDLSVGSIHNITRLQEWPDRDTIPR